MWPVRYITIPAGSAAQAAAVEMHEHAAELRALVRMPGVHVVRPDYFANEAISADANGRFDQAQKALGLSKADSVSMIAEFDGESLAYRCWSPAPLRA